MIKMYTNKFKTTTKSVKSVKEHSYNYELTSPFEMKREMTVLKSHTNTNYKRGV